MGKYINLRKGKGETNSELPVEPSQIQSTCGKLGFDRRLIEISKEKSK